MKLNPKVSEFKKKKFIQIVFDTRGLKTFIKVLTNFIKQIFFNITDFQGYKWKNKLGYKQKKKRKKKIKRFQNAFQNGDQL